MDRITNGITFRLPSPYRTPERVGLERQLCISLAVRVTGRVEYCRVAVPMFIVTLKTD